MAEMMGRGELGEEGRFGSGETGIDLYADLMAESLETEALDRLVEILRDRPELEQFVTQGSFTRASQALKGLARTLNKYPQLLVQLGLEAKARPHEVVMAILPEENLVFTQTPEGVSGFAPVLTCTHYAMDDIARGMSARRPYGFVVSNNGLIPYVLNRFENEDRPVISYERGEMKPEDYIALGAQRIFENETYRFSIVNGVIGR